MSHDQGSNQKPVTIIVNGRKKEFSGKEISFDELALLAFPTPPYGENTMYTETYNRGQSGQKGELFPGDSVHVHEEMIFNVTATDKS
jgi:hypothetical protein